MEGLLWLILLSITMFIGSFFAGTIPMAFHLSEERLKLASTFGIGLLVGTALIVIIPEGVEMLYSVPVEGVSFNLSAENNLDIPSNPSLERRDNFKLDPLQSETINKRQESKVLQEPVETPPPHSPQDEPHKEENPAHRYIGIALISGYIMMFLIDQLGSPHQHPRKIVDVTELNALTDDSEVDLNRERGHLNSKQIKSHSMTTGLVIHAAADGIALGASANEPALELIVFLALMLHKAPSAFGLCTVLLREGYTRRQIRKNVAIFAMSAPVAAILTFLTLQSSSELNPSGMQWWTAILLLFSGGTFLYVAMHVMQNVNNIHGNGKLSTTVLILGMVFPMLLEFGPEHGH